MKRLKNKTRGQSLVEFALVLPILLVIVFGIVDLSRLTYYKTVMNEAAKEGARTVCVGNPRTEVADDITRLIKPLTGEASYSITDAPDNSYTVITFTPNSGYQLQAFISPAYLNGLKAGDIIEVKLNYKMNFITPLMTVFGNDTVLLSTSYTRMETPPTE